MSVRVLPHASVSLARGATPLDPRGAHNNARARARASRTTARGTTPLDPRGAPNGSTEPARRRRVRDDARDGLAAAAVSLGGSLTVTLTLGLLLRWLG
jgi:hypothetical protein